jgi:hypothetical protein
MVDLLGERDRGKAKEIQHRLSQEWVRGPVSKLPLRLRSTRLRGSELLSESRVFPAIFARIYAARRECPRESAVPAGIE